MYLSIYLSILPILCTTMNYQLNNSTLIFQQASLTYHTIRFHRGRYTVTPNPLPFYIMMMVYVSWVLQWREMCADNLYQWCDIFILGSGHGSMLAWVVNDATHHIMCVPGRCPNDSDTWVVRLSSTMTMKQLTPTQTVKMNRQKDSPRFQNPYMRHSSLPS